MNYDKTEHMVRLTVRLCSGASISKNQIMEQCGVSIATAKRYLSELSCLLPVVARVEDRQKIYYIPQYMQQLQNPPFGKREAA